MSIKDVAKAAGTSVSTVSRALNDHPDVSEETREHVLKTARRLGYERNPFATSLISGRSGLIAIVVYAIDNDYHLQLMRGLGRAAKELDHEILFSFTEAREETLTSCTSIYRRGVADGVVVFGPRQEELQGLAELQKAGFPIVVIDPVEPLPGITSIGPTDYEGAFEATRHLIDLGHRQIGIIIESRLWGAGSGRLAGYLGAHREQRVPVDETLILEGYDGYTESGHAAARAYIEGELAPTAVLCFNDLVAYGLIQEYTQHGVRVPEQLSVIGFDDIPNSQYIPERGLTTVRQPIVEIGETALRLLVDLINHRAKPGAHIEMPMTLMIRGTTAPAPRASTALRSGIPELATS